MKIPPGRERDDCYGSDPDLVVEFLAGFCVDMGRVPGDRTSVARDT
jgi:hypothetical protein